VKNFGKPHIAWTLIFATFGFLYFTWHEMKFLNHAEYRAYIASSHFANATRIVIFDLAPLEWHCGIVVLKVPAADEQALRARVRQLGIPIKENVCCGDSTRERLRRALCEYMRPPSLKSWAIWFSLLVAWLCYFSFVKERKRSAYKQAFRQHSRLGHGSLPASEDKVGRVSWLSHFLGTTVN
jgi:hypothetical protein